MAPEIEPPNELLDHQIQLVGLYAGHLADRLTEVIEAAKAAPTAESAVTGVLTDMERDLTTCHHQIVELTAELRAATSVHQELRDQIRRAEEDRDRLRADACNMTRDAAAVKRRAAAISAESAANAEERDAVIVQLRCAETTIGSLRESLDELGADLKSERSAATLTQYEGERVRGQLQEATEALARVQAWAREAEQQKEAAHAASAGHVARIRELEQATSVLRSTLELTEKHLERVERSKAWRWGHAFSLCFARLSFNPPKTKGAVVAGLETARRGLQAAHGIGSVSLEPAREAPLPPGPSPTAPLATAPSRVTHDRFASHIRRRLGPPRRAQAEPLVTCIVLNRNGRHHLAALFDGLEFRTAYDDLEVIVVDNGSTDDSIEWLSQRAAPFAVKVIENGRNLSFAQANNEAVAHAAGDLILLLNNDVIPFESGWLREMVSVLGDERTAAVGATLLYPHAQSATQLSVQHKGIRFRMHDGYIKGVNLYEGLPAPDASFGRDLDCPAVTAACALVRRTDFDAVGGFSEDYLYGTEDVELGLRFCERGRAVRCAGRAFVLHNESATQRVEGREFMRANRMRNRRVFVSRWAARLRRELRLSQLDEITYWIDDPPHIAITVTSTDERDGYGDWHTAHEIGEALESIGWMVSYAQRRHDEWYALPDDIGYVLVLLDAFDVRRINPGVVTIGWIRNWTERWTERPWFYRIDVLLASSERSIEIIEDLTGLRADPFPLATNPERFRRRPPVPELESDYVFAGSYFDSPRAIQSAIDPTPDERFLLFGKNWENDPQLAAWSRGHVPYDRLPDIYASTKIVIDDAGEHARPYGSVNARVFDALAAGALPLSNGGTGVGALFGDGLPTWDSRDSLRQQLDRLLADDSLRERLIEPFRQLVLKEHTYGRRARQLHAILREREERLSFCIKIGAPNWDVAQHWGDLHFAQAIARELSRCGHRSLVQVLPEWDDEVGMAYDVVLHLRGLSRYAVKPGQLNVMWHLSHPEDVGPAELDGYDIVFVASALHAEQLARTSSTCIAVLEQATDSRLFFPDPAEELAHELVFVGNSRKVRRKILSDLLPTNRDVAVWGRDWEGLIDMRLVVDEFIPNDQLRHVYSSAGIVLCDHWDDMREHGFVSNRIYDALACGAVVLSDDVPGLEQFGDAVVSYNDPAQLGSIVDELLSDPESCAERGRRGRDLILSRHTFAHRVEAMLLAVRDIIREHEHPLAISAEGAARSTDRRAKIAVS